MSICSLSHLTMTKSIGLNKRRNSVILKDHATIQQYLDHPAYVEAVGVIRFEQLKSNCYALEWQNVDFGKGENIPRDMAAIGENSLKYFQVIIDFLWLVKDNSVGIRAVDTFFGKGDFVMSTTLPLSSASKADGNFSSTEFDEKEIKTFFDCFLKFSQIHNIPIPNDPPDQDFDITKNVQDVKKTANQNIKTRLEKAYTSINIARSQRYLPAKIAMCIGAFECLFSYDAANIMNTVSERIAGFLEDDQVRQAEIFNFFKEAYDVRSSFLHGGQNKIKSAEELIAMSIKVDDCLRASMTKAIIFESDNFLAGYKKHRGYVKSLQFLEPENKE
jgi:hypothetical protein